MRDPPTQCTRAPPKSGYSHVAGIDGSFYDTDGIRHVRELVAPVRPAGEKTKKKHVILSLAYCDSTHVRGEEQARHVGFPFDTFDHVTKTSFKPPGWFGIWVTCTSAELDEHTLLVRITCRPKKGICLLPTSECWDASESYARTLGSESTSVCSLDSSHVCCSAAVAAAAPLSSSPSPSQTD